MARKTEHRDRAPHHASKTGQQNMTPDTSPVGAAEDLLSEAWFAPPDTLTLATPLLAFPGADAPVEVRADEHFDTVEARVPAEEYVNIEVPVRNAAPVEPPAASAAPVEAPVSAAPEAPVEAPAVKRRGRPPGSKNKSKDDPTRAPPRTPSARLAREEEAGPMAPTPRRGRPPKSAKGRSVLEYLNAVSKHFVLYDGKTVVLSGSDIHLVDISPMAAKLLGLKNHRELEFDRSCKIPQTMEFTTATAAFDFYAAALHALKPRDELILCSDKTDWVEAKNIHL